MKIIFLNKNMKLKILVLIFNNKIFKFKNYIN
jgi:hypothetical protein